MATSFSTETYLGQDATEIARQFRTLRKDDLMTLGQHFSLDVKTTMRKAQLQELVLKQLIEEDVIEGGSVDLPNTGPNALEMRKLELEQFKQRSDQELHCKRLEMEREERVRKEKLEDEEKVRQENDRL